MKRSMWAEKFSATYFGYPYFDKTWLHHAIQLLSRWHHQSRQRYLLGRLDVDRLNDIGLTRKQAKLESEKWFWQS